ncbi:uncharacterized protein LOC135109616 isoform X2 [Scylla paramamosain]|uniref:uncharacterized protein LOC135109616 isoform X2 n=1 Tax=Scylla paramamosain TaxID=85552 RepID=UPI003083C631
MLTTALTVIKKFFGISTDVREATKRPLEEESENEFEEVILHDTEPQKKKRCSYVDYLLTSSNNTPGFSPVLMQFPWLTGRKENPNKVSDVKMNSHKSQQQKEGCGAEATVIEERVKKWSAPFPCSTSLSVSCTSELENDFEAMERRKARSVGELATCCHPPAHSSLADFRFVPSSSGSVQSDFPSKQKSRNSDCLSSSRNHKSKMRKSDFKGPPTTVLRLLGKKKSSSFLSSRIKHSLVHKSFLHEEKIKYRQLLQQYIDHYWTPNSKVLSHKVSSLPSSPVGMVTRSHWTPFLTKKKQEEIENKSSNPSSLRLLPYADNSVLEEVMGKKKIVGLDENLEKYEKQKKSSSIHVLLVDLSKEDNEEQNTCDRESDGDSVIMIKEMLSPRAQRNSLEERFKEHPLYDLEWVKTMQKEYEDRAYIAQKNANTTSELIQELQQRRNKKVSLHEKVTQGLKLLDLTYPSKYTEVQLPDEEEEEILVPLTPEMENEIDDALNKIPQSEVLIEKFHIQITRRDIKTLDGLNWLNDELTCGVPQGTKMDPLCFLLLINDALTDTPQRWKYVDDCTVGVPVSTKNPDYSPLQAILEQLQTWTEESRMTINHNKTVVMHFCTSSVPVPPPQLSVGPHPLQVVRCAKLLGVMVDDQLTWKQHVASTIRSATYRLYMLRRLRSLGTPTDELRGVYVTFILPKLMYASPVWSSSLTQTQQLQLESVQKRACRVILGPAYTTYEEALNTLRLSRLSTRYREALEKFGRGLLNHPRLRNMLLPDAPRPARATRHHNKITPLKAPRMDRYRLSVIPTMVRAINQ